MVLWLILVLDQIIRGARIENIEDEGQHALHLLYKDLQASSTFPNLNPKHYHRLMDLNHAKIVMLVHLMVVLVKGYVYHVVYAPMDNTQVLVQPHVLHVHQVDLYQI